jgi:hypothetical protein
MLLRRGLPPTDHFTSYLDAMEVPESILEAPFASSNPFLVNPDRRPAARGLALPRMSSLVARGRQNPTARRPVSILPR